MEITPGLNIWQINIIKTSVLSNTIYRLNVTFRIPRQNHSTKDTFQSLHDLCGNAMLGDKMEWRAEN